MIGAPEANIQLKDEDVRKIELANIRLSTVQQEVLYATKRLATLVEEENKAREAREYVEGQRVKLESEVESLSKQKEDLDMAIRISLDSLREHEGKHEEMHKTHGEKMSEFNNRERVVQEAEQSLSLRAQEFAIREKTLEEKRSEVENVQSAFLQALESVTWK